MFLCVLIPLCTQTSGWSCTFEITISEVVLTFKKLHQEHQNIWRLLSSMAVDSFSVSSIHKTGAGRKGWVFWCLTGKHFAGRDINLGVSFLFSYLYWNSFEEVHVTKASPGSWNWFENDQLIKKKWDGWNGQALPKGFPNFNEHVRGHIDLWINTVKLYCLQWDLLQRLLSEIGNFLLQIYRYWSVHWEWRYRGLL